MLKREKRLYILLSLSTFLTAAICSGASQDEIDQAKKKLSETKRKENSVMGALLRTQQELERINSNLSSLTGKLTNAERRMVSITTEINNAQRELDQLKVQIGGHRGLLDQRLVAYYKYGYQSPLEILFSSRNFAEFVTRCEMVRRFTRVDLHAIKNLQTEQDLIIRKKQEIIQKQQELAAQKNLYARLENQNKWEHERQLRENENKQKELAALQSDRQALEQALDEFEQTSKDMEDQIRLFQNQNQTALGTGKYIWAVPGDVIQSFGWRVHPILRRRKLHTGIDIVAPLGRTIVAADSGIIIFSDRNGGYGKMISIDHGAGFSTVYAHCSVLLVTVGQQVTKGQPIAKVGTTGLSTGPHLHFEIRKAGVPVDPLSYL